MLYSSSCKPANSCSDFLSACLILGLNSELESSCLPEQLRYLIQFSHAFEYDANRFGGCFCLGSGPVLCFGLSLVVCFAVSAGETQIWLGDLRVVFFVWLFFVCFIDLHMLRTFLSLYSVLTAYSHVRTEPQCDIGQTRGKKIELQASKN